MVWQDDIKSAEKIALVGDSLRKIHYKFVDGREMIEEYSLDTGVLSKRAWKHNSGIRKDKWEVEVGDPSGEIAEDLIQSIGIQESKNAPFVIHRITKTKLEWRIKNLPYPLDCYNITVEIPGTNIVIRTTNKKFFKKIPILELQRLNLTANESALKYSQYMNTLIITYDKPQELIKFEEKLAKELSLVPVLDDGDLDCKPS